MFWRRGRKEPKDAAATGDAQDGEDDLLKLQRQFGIKTVSNKDVEAEFMQLLGGAGKASAGKGGLGLELGLSPRSQLALFGDGDGESDEEAKILRELNLTGNIDSINADELSGDDEDDEEDEGAKLARRELKGVLDDAHRSAMRAQAGRSVEEERPAQPPVKTESTEEMRGRIHALKLKAVALKREGNVQEALAVFREVKTLEARLPSEGVAVTATSSRAVTSTVVTESRSGAVAVETRQQRVVQSTTSYDVGFEDEEKDVDVTDEDMENPEYLAQLAALGLAVGPSRAKKEAVNEVTIKSLEKEIQDVKERALSFKRADRIADALAEMRKIKELEAKLSDLRAKSPDAAPVDTKAVVEVAVLNAATAVVESALAASRDDLDVQVTDDDMNDPAYAAELAKMGLDVTALSDDDDADDNAPSEVSAPVFSPPRDPMSTPPPRPQYMSERYSSIDDNDLIDEFEDADEDEAGDGDGSDVKPDNEDAPSFTREAEPQNKPLVCAPTVAAQNSPLPPSEPALEVAPSSGFTVEELQAQLQQAKLSAVQLKRQGNLDGALGMMRRMKQIENLIEMKQRQPQLSPVAAPPPVPTRSPQDVARDRQFQELEVLLVRFANEATREAKEQLSVNRGKAAEWLARRKEYSAHLATLREKRQLSGQGPPSYQIQQLTEQIEVEHADIANDEVHFRIESVNDLQSMAGKDVMVKFNLSFPSSAPHEGKSGIVRVSPSSPFSSGPIKSENAFRFKILRSRGSQRLFEIKKATFEVWRPGTLLRNPEFIARGYQELAPLLTTSEVRCHVPFVGPNRKPVGGDVEITFRLRTPLREKEYRTLITEILSIGEYPLPRVPVASLPSTPTPRPPSNSEPEVPVSTQDSRLHSQSDASTRIPASAMPAKAAQLPHTQSEPSIPTPVARSTVPAVPVAVDSAEDPHDLDLIISYDVINDEIERIETALPTFQGEVAAEYSDRLDALGLKKQLLEIDMQTEKLTLDMYVAKLKQRIVDDRQIIVRLMKTGRKPDAARVLRRVKIMEKELEGADDQGEDP